MYMVTFTIPTTVANWVSIMYLARKMPIILIHYFGCLGGIFLAYYFRFQSDIIYRNNKNNNKKKLNLY